MSCVRSFTTLELSKKEVSTVFFETDLKASTPTSGSLHVKLSVVSICCRFIIIIPTLFMVLFASVLKYISFFIQVIANFCGCEMAY